MAFFVLKRLGSLVVSLFVASIIVFVVVQLLPGDVAQMILGRSATPESLDAIRRSLGLYEPLHLRYLKWMMGVLRGDLGESLSVMGWRISDLLVQRAYYSLFLAGWAMVIIVPIALFLGTIAGLKHDSALDKFISLTTIVAFSLPEFATGAFLIFIFALCLKWLPAASAINPSVSLIKQLPALILPILTLSLALLGYQARMVRSSVIEVSSSNYVRTAFLKGLPRKDIFLRYVLRNALLPSVTVIAMNIGWLIGGLVIVETVFGYPGVGSLVLFAIVQRDVPLIQATVLFVVMGYVVLNFVADLLYMYLNPRIRHIAE